MYNFFNQIENNVKNQILLIILRNWLNQKKNKIIKTEYHLQL